MKTIQEQALEYADMIVINDQECTFPVDLTPFVAQLRTHHLRVHEACNVLQSWLAAGWIPPSISIQSQTQEFGEMRKELDALKKDLRDLKSKIGHEQST
jgi:hypothetical protein